MIEAYSQDLTLNAMRAIPFNSVTVEKGCTAKATSPTTFAMNTWKLLKYYCQKNIKL